MLYTYNKNVFWGEGWKREKKWWMKSKVILGIEERGKVEKRERQYDWLHFPVMGTLLFLTMYLDTFSIERWSLCPLFFIMEKLVTTLEAVLCDFWNYIRWLSFCPVFSWCSLLESTPMMWGPPSSSKEVLLKLHLRSSLLSMKQPPDMEGSEHLDELSPSHGVASAKVLMWRDITNISFQNSQLIHRIREHGNCFISLSVFSCSNGSKTVGIKKGKWK